MVNIAIPYGKSHQTLCVPEERVRAVLRPKPLKREEDETVLIQSALENPIACQRLCEIAQSHSRVLLITSDHTRPVPSRVTIPLYLAEIRKGNPKAEITILIATGLHRKTTPAELRIKLGDEIVDRETIVVHEAGKDELMTYFGHLPSGGELWLNHLVKENDLVVAEGFVEPHFFAGFSGGRKSILPGVAARRTVLYNHNAAFIQSPQARQGQLEGNPIHRDMLFAAKKAKLRFVLNVLLDMDKRVIAAFAGDVERAHLEGCRLCKQLMRVPCVRADIVITSNGGYPLDQNVYQTVKGMTAAESCVRPGGVIIMCAALGDGHGGEAFYHWFADRANAAQVTHDIESIPAASTCMDQWEAQILARVLQKATCIFVTGEENRAIIEAMHMQWAPEVNTAVRMADERLGANASITVIPDGVGVIIDGETPNAI